ncbi:hypothetical protein NIES25_51820 [Nostoc linckia NIES-25]|nr:hypothetical protein NIES25_05740 [Nostoc linckia NIES-25]BAY78678.1 hypothetical protein NIES25_51540 [Nostoc linckia NIES-25]BAY78706.1 hypothetical protein NIES25_51820 [Nostoc linckia NIES-25]
MTKPVGYYTNYTPGDGSLLEKLQADYGAQFQLMTRREKLFLISSLASQLCDLAPGRCRDEIYEIGHQINSVIALGDREGLIEALINQVRYGQQSTGELPMQQ